MTSFAFSQVAGSEMRTATPLGGRVITLGRPRPFELVGLNRKRLRRFGRKTNNPFSHFFIVCNTPIGPAVTPYQRRAIEAPTGANRHPDMRRRSQSLAVVHSRLTVAGEMLITSAISSTVKPAKYRISTISA